MEWIKLDLRALRSPEYIGSEPECRATWLNLLAYCADEENGGRIVGASKWKDRMWQQLCGVTLHEVGLESELYHWEGEDLIIWGYPVDTENLVKTRREAGRKGGEQAKPNFASSKTEAKPDFASTEQSRAEESRAYKSRAEGKPGCGVSVESVCDWIDQQNGTIPDSRRAKSLAKELIAEMSAKKWRIDGQLVANPMGLLINRLKRDKAYFPK